MLTTSWSSISRLVALLAATMSLPGVGVVAGQGLAAVSPPRPNVLIILTDDQRAGTVAGMPVTRRVFGEQGKHFENAFATTPLCCPSRASILSGRYAHNHGVHVNKDGLKLDHSTTVQASLQAAGYRTGVAGKFLNAWPVENDPPYWHRWAIFNPTTSPGHTGTRFNADGRMQTIERYSTDYVADRGVDFLQGFEKRDDDPWLIFLAPYAPHAPFDPPARYAGTTVRPWAGDRSTSESDRRDKPRWVRSHRLDPEAGTVVARQQGRMLLAVDDLVAQMFHEMDRLDEARDTVAIFMSDNGSLWGEHGIVGKRQPYSGSVRVPLLLRWPGHVTPGAADERLVATVDVAPTILDATGVSSSSGVEMDGRSLLASSRRSELLLEHWAGNGVPSWASIWTAGSQYIEYYGDSGRVTFREFYDLKNDPSQLLNLLRDGTRANDPNASALHRRLTSLKSCVGASCP